MPQLVEVRFKGNRKAYFEWHEPEPLRTTEPVIVECERGHDFGVVSAIGAVAELKCTRCTGCAVNSDEGHRGDSARREPEPTRRVVRRASQTDRKTMEDLRRQEDTVRRKVREKATAHGLQMKVSDAEWQWDKNRLTVYFTAEKRVDFRTLVRELASQFRTRIELRQIGVRDEAARLNGIGRCGREYCSATWLPELRPIGLHIAKDQRLSLNPSQISGPCGRLLCCLRYEHEFYVQSRKRFPKEGKVVRTLVGNEKVHSIDIFRDRVTLRTEDGAFRTVPLADLKQEVEQAGQAPAAGGAPAVAIAAPPPPREPRPEGRARQKQAPRGRPAADSQPATADAPEAPHSPLPIAHSPASPDAAAPIADSRPRRRGRRGGRRRRKGPPA